MSFDVIKFELIQGLSRDRNSEPPGHDSVEPVSNPMRMSETPILDSDHSCILVHEVIRSLMANFEQLPGSTSSYEFFQSGQ